MKNINLFVVTHTAPALSARSFAAYKSWIEMYWFGGWPRDVSTRRKQFESVHRRADPKCPSYLEEWKITDNIKSQIEALAKRGVWVAPLSHQSEQTSEVGPDHQPNSTPN